MLSVIMSGLNVAQKDLEVSANNMANANTVGFKRSQASFLDVFANDPNANPKTAVGTGAMTASVQRVTSQGAMTSTDSVTDLAVAGKGFFIMGAEGEGGAKSYVYTRAGNFGINANGQIVDSLKNQLQCFPVVDGEMQSQLTGASILSEKQPADIRVSLDSTAVEGTVVSLKLNGGEIASKTLTSADITNGYASFSYDGVTSLESPHLSADYANTTVRVPLIGGENVAGQTVELKNGADVIATKVLTQADVALGYIDVKLPASTSIDSLSSEYTTTGSDRTYADGSIAEDSTDTSLIKLTLGQNDLVGHTVKLMSGSQVLASKVLTSDDVNAGFVTWPKADLGGVTDPAQMTAKYIQSGVSVVMNNTIQAQATTQIAASEYRASYLQGISINSKGLIQATYGDGSRVDVGYIALATFRNESGLKPTGNTNFVATDDSGPAIQSKAGAPAAGDILSGTLEQANVDITHELMTMLRAQQVYNGNARMLQTAVEVASRITDKI